MIEDLNFVMHKVEAYILEVSEEKELVGKTLLSLDSKVGVTDLLSEEDMERVTSLKAENWRELCSEEPSSLT